MKVGNIVNGLEVIDVKRVNKLNLVQFTKAVSEYIDQGYKLDVNSARQVGLVLQIDMYKLDTTKKEVVDTKVEKQPEPIVELAAIEPITNKESEETPEVVEVAKKTTSRTKKAT